MQKQRQAMRGYTKTPKTTFRCLPAYRFPVEGSQNPNTPPCLRNNLRLQDAIRDPIPPKSHGLQPNPSNGSKPEKERLAQTPSLAAPKTIVQAARTDNLEIRKKPAIIDRHDILRRENLCRLLVLGRDTL